MARARRCVRVAGMGVIAALFMPAISPASDPRAVPQLGQDDTTARPQVSESPPPIVPMVAVPAMGGPSALATRELAVPRGLRLLVVAPHPDDETLAAGGLIQRVRARGGTVRVVFVTNGDGYVDAVSSEAEGRQARADFLAYGRRRHGEALEAIHLLGLNKHDTTFLGFPDDGIDDLWADHWSRVRPYRSPHTHATHPPYRESWNPHAEYAGADLQREIEEGLRAFAPDWVLIPDPRDRHPDHCTTGVFVLQALGQLHRLGSAKLRVLTYLVHSPDYPASPAWPQQLAGTGVGGSPTARALLAPTPWLSLPLTEAELQVKRNAVSAYQSQVHVMRPFLMQFLRSNELFGALDWSQVTVVPREYARRYGHR
jgi:LmbE family N-acetylglucosaminyl deacetylase